MDESVEPPARTVLEFDTFYRAEFTGLVAVAAAVLGRRAGAEDVVQDAMIDAHRRWDRLAGYDLPRAWVRRVVVQRAMKVARKRSNERVAHLRSVGGARQVTPAPEPADPTLLNALGALPPRQRAVMALHYLEDASVQTIADVMGIAVGTVKAHLSHGREALAGQLQRDSDTPPSPTSGDDIAGTTDPTGASS